MRVLLSQTTSFSAKVGSILKAGGFSLTRATEATELLESLDLVGRAIFVLEAEMPELSWKEALRRIRARQPEANILLVMEQDDTEAEILAIASGVDDVIAPRMAEKEIVARAQRIVTRKAGFSSPVLRFGALTIVVAAQRAFWGEHEIRLTPSLYQILEHLVLREGHAVSGRELVDLIYGTDEQASVRTVHVFMHKLRKALAEAGAPRDLIVTSQRRGFILKRPERRDGNRPETRDWWSQWVEAA